MCSRWGGVAGLHPLRACSEVLDLRVPETGHQFGRQDHQVRQNLGGAMDTLILLKDRKAHLNGIWR
jgi:hypothetical protein